MLRNQLMGYVNSQINKGESIYKDLFHALDFPSLHDIERRYDEWDGETSRILKSAFVTSYQAIYREFTAVIHSNNVYEENEFEIIRSRIAKKLPVKLDILEKLKSRLPSLSETLMLPVNPGRLSVRRDEIETTDKPSDTEVLIGDKGVNMNQATDLKCDYVIITALETDEMEQVLSFINVEHKIDNNKHLIEYGSLKADSNKKIAFASQQSTGMVDAGILSTELIMRFQPKFLIMAGVLGGKPGLVNIGDVIVANRIRTIDKGKISEAGFQKEIEGGDVTSAAITNIMRNQEKITDFIKAADPTRRNRISVHFGSVVCVRQVVDMAGFFEENISVDDRKAVALEMESYGVKRACDLVNNGHTTPLIIKSAMDNTVDKTDNAKTYAAWTSAKFVQYILENNLI